VGFVYFPNEQYEEDGFWGQIALFLPLFYLIGMIYPVIWTTKIVVTEKEMGMAALLKTNSVTQSMITGELWGWCTAELDVFFPNLLSLQLHPPSSPPSFPQ
jgi:hypothetical protein